VGEQVRVRVVKVGNGNKVGKTLSDLKGGNGEGDSKRGRTGG
jgi:hypothetical protein